MTNLVRFTVLSLAAILSFGACQQDDDPLASVDVPESMTAAPAIVDPRNPAYVWERGTASPAQDGPVADGIDALPEDKPSSGAGAFISVTPQTQQHKNLCWAAITSIVASTHGQDVAQCMVPALTVGQYGIATVQSCCTSYDEKCDIVGNTHNALLATAGIDSRYDRNPLSEEQLQHELANHRLVAASVRNDAGGHIMLVHAMTPIAGHMVYRVINTAPPQNTAHAAYPDADPRILVVNYDTLANGFTVGGGIPAPWSATTWRFVQN